MDSLFLRHRLELQFQKQKTTHTNSLRDYLNDRFITGPRLSRFEIYLFDQIFYAINRK